LVGLNAMFGNFLTKFLAVLLLFHAIDSNAGSRIASERLVKEIELYQALQQSLESPNDSEYQSFRDILSGRKAYKALEKMSVCTTDIFQLDPAIAATSVFSSLYCEELIKDGIQNVDPEVLARSLRVDDLEALNIMIHSLCQNKSEVDPDQFREMFGEEIDGYDCDNSYELEEKRYKEITEHTDYFSQADALISGRDLKMRKRKYCECANRSSVISYNWPHQKEKASKEYVKKAHQRMVREKTKIWNKKFEKIQDEILQVKVLKDLYPDRNFDEFNCIKDQADISAHLKNNGACGQYFASHKKELGYKDVEALLDDGMRSFLGRGSRGKVNLEDAIAERIKKRWEKYYLYMINTSAIFDLDTSHLSDEDGGLCMSPNAYMRSKVNAPFAGFLTNEGKLMEVLPGLVNDFDQIKALSDSFDRAGHKTPFLEVARLFYDGQGSDPISQIEFLLKDSPRMEFILNDAESFHRYITALSPFMVDEMLHGRSQKRIGDTYQSASQTSLSVIFGNNPEGYRDNPYEAITDYADMVMPAYRDSVFGESVNSKYIKDLESRCESLFTEQLSDVFCPKDLDQPKSELEVQKAISSALSQSKDNFGSDGEKSFDNFRELSNYYCYPGNNGPYNIALPSSEYDENDDLLSYTNSQDQLREDTKNMDVEDTAHLVDDFNACSFYRTSDEGHGPDVMFQSLEVDSGRVNCCRRDVTSSDELHDRCNTRDEALVARAVSENKKYKTEEYRKNDIGYKGGQDYPNYYLDMEGLFCERIIFSPFMGINVFEHEVNAGDAEQLSRSQRAYRLIVNAAAPAGEQVGDLAKAVEAQHEAESGDDSWSYSDLLEGDEDLMNQMNDYVVAALEGGGSDSIWEFGEEESDDIVADNINADSLDDTYIPPADDLVSDYVSDDSGSSGSSGSDYPGSHVAPAPAADIGSYADPVSGIDSGSTGSGSVQEAIRDEGAAEAIAALEQEVAGLKDQLESQGQAVSADDRDGDGDVAEASGEGDSDVDAVAPATEIGDVAVADTGSGGSTELGDDEGAFGAADAFGAAGVSDAAIAPASARDNYVDAPDYGFDSGESGSSNGQQGWYVDPTEDGHWTESYVRLGDEVKVDELSHEITFSDESLEIMLTNGSEDPDALIEVGEALREKGGLSPDTYYFSKNNIRYKLTVLAGSATKLEIVGEAEMIASGKKEESVRAPASVPAAEVDVDEEGAKWEEALKELETGRD